MDCRKADYDCPTYYLYWRYTRKLSWNQISEMNGLSLSGNRHRYIKYNLPHTDLKTKQYIALELSEDQQDLAEIFMKLLIRCARKVKHQKPNISQFIETFKELNNSGKITNKTFGISLIT